MFNIICNACKNEIDVKSYFCPYCGYINNKQNNNLFLDLSNRYGEGCYKIGFDIPEGEYRLFCIDKNYNGYYVISTDANANKIISNDNFTKNSYINVSTNQFLRLRNCVAILTNNLALDNIKDFLIEGTVLLKYEGINKVVSVPKGITAIADGAFEDCFNIIQVSIPQGVTKIGNYAFNMCHNLSNIYLPLSVSTIGEGAFAECSKMTTISLPNSITKIPKAAFSLCENLTHINLMGNVSIIDDYAFAECINLYDIILPDSISKIGKFAFQNCIKLKNVSLPDRDIDISPNAFDNCSQELYEKLTCNNDYFQLMDTQRTGSHRVEHIYSERDASSFDEYQLNH